MKEIIITVITGLIILLPVDAGTYDILDYGAVKNQKSTAAIQKAVDDCHASDIEELVFTDITIETRLHNGQWWGHGSRFIYQPCRDLTASRQEVFG